MQYIPDISPAYLLSADDPPIRLYGGFPPDQPEKDENFYTHGPDWGIGFAELAHERGADVSVSYLGHGDATSKEDILDTLIDTIKAQPSSVATP